MRYDDDMKWSVTRLPDKAGTPVITPEVVKLEVGGPVPLLMARHSAEKLLASTGVLPHNFEHFIEGDPNAIDDEEVAALL